MLASFLNGFFFSLGLPGMNDIETDFDSEGLLRNFVN